MRKGLKLPGCAILLVLLTLCAIGQPAQANPADGLADGNEYWVALRQVDFAQCGSSPAVVARVDGRLPAGKDAPKIRVALFSDAPAGQAVVAQSPRVGAGKYPEFIGELSAMLKPAGISVFEQAAGSIKKSDAARVIIAPSGAWPKRLGENMALGENDSVVFFGSMPQFVLDDDGNASAVEPQKWLLANGRQIDVGGQTVYVNTGYWGGRAFVVPKMLDQMQSPKEAAKIAASLAMLGDERIAVGGAQGEWGAGGGLVIANATKKTEKLHARISVIGADGELVRSWDREVEILQGDISGPSAVYGGRDIGFSVAIRRTPAKKEDVGYSAVVLSEDGAKLYEQQIGNGSTANNQTWIGSFGIKDFFGYGIRQVEVRDQYGRVYARAYCRSVNVSISQLDHFGSMRRFEVMLDSSPAPWQKISVLAPGAGKWADAQMEGGIARVVGRWEEGGGTKFEINGTVFSLAGGEGGLAAPWGALVLLLLAASAAGLVTLLGRKREFRVFGPKDDGAALREIRIAKPELLRIVSDACRAKGARIGAGVLMPVAAEDIAPALKARAKNEGMRGIDTGSVSAALGRLASDGLLCVCCKKYIVKRGGAGCSDARMLHLLELAWDEAVVCGNAPKIILQRAGGKLGITIKAGKEGWVIAQEGQGAKNIGTPFPQKIIFHDEDEIAQFVRATAREAGGAKLAIAIKTGRTRLVRLGRE